MECGPDRRNNRNRWFIVGAIFLLMASTAVRHWMVLLPVYRRLQCFHRICIDYAARFECVFDEASLRPDCVVRWQEIGLNALNLFADCGWLLSLQAPQSGQALHRGQREQPARSRQRSPGNRTKFIFISKYKRTTRNSMNSAAPHRLSGWAVGGVEGRKIRA